jgi:predicted regulator of Ras-like GTPase activity (Roadblock/LC7/MglB family)
VETYLRRLMEIEGVIGALFVGRDGMVVASTLAGDEEELVGAMIAACLDSTDRYIGQVGLGSVRYALFETPGGSIQVANGGEVLVAAQANPHAALGRIRLELQQIARRMAQEIGSR